MKIWPQSKIRELLAQAKLSGEARAELDSRQAAERFRYAIYSFRRAHNVGFDVSVTLDETSVVLTRRDIPEVRIHAGEEAMNDAV